jgi:RHS repeat-associated protein
MTDRLHDDGSGDPCGPTPSFGARLELSNREYLAGPGGVPSSTTTNRISALGSACFPGAVVAHGEAGSVVQDQFGTYQHDALSRLEVATPFGGDPELHGFDAADRRVRRAVGDVTRSWVRGPDGAVLAEYESGGGGAPALVRRHVNAFGNVVADVLDDTLDPQGEPEVRFHHHDHLGSTRVVTDGAGLAAGARILHFTPFGAEVPDGDGACPEGRYALHERDESTGLTYMLARFQSPWHARFLEVDPADDSDVMLPQSWNRYSYVRSHPLGAVDPSGESVYSTIGRVAVYTFRHPRLRRVATVTGNEKTTLRTVTGALDSVDMRDGAKRVIVVDGPEARQRVAGMLSTDGTALKVERSGPLPSHQHPNAGPYADVHVQTRADTAAVGFIKGLLPILAPMTVAAAASSDATAAEVASAALWDTAKAVDPFCVTDVLEWATGADEYAQQPVVTPEEGVE